jgi:tRNA threonylcarbamoyladenosine biosynthesis protein TsaB
MKILILDTCGATGNVALADTALQPAIVARASLPGRTASERLVVTIRDLAATAATVLQSLDAVAVVSGPGSFTGVRVGLSAAKGLCESLGLPLIAISRLELLALVGAGTDVAAAGSIGFALLDAGRGEVYLGVYADGVRLREALVTRQQLLAALDEAAGANPVWIVACESAVAQSFAELRPRLVAEPTAEDALALVLPRIEAGDFDDAATLDANYLRRIDAEILLTSGSAPPATANVAVGAAGRLLPETPAF